MPVNTLPAVLAVAIALTGTLAIAIFPIARQLSLWRCLECYGRWFFGCAWILGITTYLSLSPSKGADYPHVMFYGSTSYLVVLTVRLLLSIKGVMAWEGRGVTKQNVTLVIAGVLCFLEFILAYFALSLDLVDLPL